MLKDSLDYHVAEGLRQATAMRSWLPQLTAELELPAAELFLKLRRGDIKARGKLLPRGVEIIDFVEQDNPYSRSDFDNLIDTDIPSDIWTMTGIDWLANAVSARGQCYCDISMSIAVLMGVFPASRSLVGKAEYVGEFFRNRIR